MPHLAVHIHPLRWHITPGRWPNSFGYHDYQWLCFTLAVIPRMVR